MPQVDDLVPPVAPQPAVAPNDTQPPPPKQPRSVASQIIRAILIAVGLTALSLIALIVFGIVAGLNSFQSTCDKEYDQAVKQSQATASSLKSLALLDDIVAPKVQSSVIKECIDTRPTAAPEVTYNLDAKAGVLVPKVQAKLAGLGYVEQPAPQLQINDCGKAYAIYHYVKAGQKLQVYYSEVPLSGNVECSGTKTVDAATLFTHSITGVSLSN